MVDKVPADITPGSASRGSVVHASDAGLGNLSRSHSEEGISRLQSAINAYSVTLTYNIGDIVKEQSLFWRNITAIVTPEVFDSAKWELISNEIGLFVCAYNTTAGTPNNFWPVSGNNAINNATENNVQVAMPDPIILGDYTVVVTANTRDNTTDWRIRVNNVDGNGVITVGAGLTGVFQDLANTDVLAALDLINYTYVENVTTTGNMTIGSAAMKFIRAPV